MIEKFLKDIHKTLNHYVITPWVFSVSLMSDI